MSGPGENDLVKGTVFNIQHYSIHDGPGIRTDVFLKGCFLSCIWCQNPESQSLRPELFYISERCAGCGQCASVCPQKAIRIQGAKSVTDRAKCRGSGRCAWICPNEARSLMGIEMSVQEVLAEVKSDQIFYKRSGGGVTLTGGDPLFQPDFALNLLSLCHQSGIHTAIETCGYAPWPIFKDVLQYVDLVLFDLKHMDPEKHRQYTGVPNSLILENVRKIYHELGTPIWARIPVIPGYNDSVQNIRTTAEFITAELGTNVPVYLLPYHRLGESKYAKLEREEQGIEITPPSDQHVQDFQQIFRSCGLETHVGG